MARAQLSKSPSIMGSSAGRMTPDHADTALPPEAPIKRFIFLKCVQEFEVEIAESKKGQKAIFRMFRPRQNFRLQNTK